MKKSYLIASVCVLVILSFNISAQSIALPAANLSQAPLGTVENNGAGIASFTFSESSGLEVPSEAFGLPNISISVDLNYVELQDKNVNTITGSLLDYFTVSYDDLTSILLFKQTIAIPGDWIGTVHFPIYVIQNSTELESYNGFNANISAIDGKTDAVGHAAIYTYTDPSIFSEKTLDALLFEILPDTTNEVLIILLLEKKNEIKMELINHLGEVVLVESYSDLDTISLHIDSLPAATYALKIIADGASQSTPFVKD